METGKAPIFLDKQEPLLVGMQNSHSKKQENLPIGKSQNDNLKQSVSNSIESLALESTAPRFAELEEKIGEKLNNLQAQIDELKGVVEKKLPEEADDKRYRYTPDPKLRPYSDLYVAEDQSSYGLKKDFSEPEETEDLPLAENLAAGIPIEAFDSGETYPVPKKFLKRGKKYCVAKIKGTSMTEAGITDGSFVLLEYTDTALSGEIMVVKYGDQTTLKRLSQKEDGAWELLYEDGSSAVIPLKDGDWEVKGHYVRVLS
ncbi:peptidase S24 [Treponema sp. OMZ 787]|nr:peptidase S24 [Treponema sp. OMZ 787]